MGGRSRANYGTKTMSKNAEKPAACRDFLDGYSDFRDGLLSESRHQCGLDHLDDCVSCNRYDRVVDEGVKLLRGLGEEAVVEREGPELPSFMYTQAQDEPLRAEGSSFSFSAAGAVAVLLGVAAWVPSLTHSALPELEMAPIMAVAPEITTVPGFFPQPAALRVMPVDHDLVDSYRPLLYQYLPLSTGNATKAGTFQRD